MNSPFPNKKHLAPNRSLFMTNKFESKRLQKFYVSSKQEKECYRKTSSYLEQPSRHFCQHFMRRIPCEQRLHFRGMSQLIPRKCSLCSQGMRRSTHQKFLAINLASQQKTTKLYFFSQVRKQFKLLTVSFKPLGCCLRSDKLVNCHVRKASDAKLA